ncbi:MAG: hypothetical protein AMXMBFR61_23860 [Fimbriimonadales bacterium]
MSSRKGLWCGAQRGSSPWPWIVGIGCGAILLACIVFAIFMKPLVEQGMQLAYNMTTCTENLQSVSTALQRYRGDHGGQYPRTLEELVPSYLADKSVLKCPADSAVRRDVSYTYTPPAAGTQANSVVVRCDLHNIAGEKIHIVLQADGKVIATDDKGVPLKERRRPRGR